MQRILVIPLAIFDAALVVAAGLVALLAPLTVLWALAFGASGDWGALWPTTATLWQFGHAVPLEVTIPDAVLRAIGLAPDAAQFDLSLAPLAFLLFTVIFAARSGARAARAGAAVLGVVTSIAAVAVFAWLVAITGASEFAPVSGVRAVLFPTVAFGAGALAGAGVTVWREGEGRVIERVHEWLELRPVWTSVPGHLVRGGAIAVVTLIGAGAALVALSIAMNAGAIVGLYEALRVDGLGATMLTLGQLAYLPTFIVWAISWLAGPGFAVGAGTAVSPAGTELGIVPAIPVFAALPENTSMWTLIVVLVPLAAGAFAGWAIRSRISWEGEDLPLISRATIALGVALFAAGFGALAAVLASGSIGPGRMAVTGPEPGPLALALGITVLIGAGILLLSPRHRAERRG